MFQNRYDAGRQLAEKLMKYQAEKPIIMALPRGRSIGYEVAQALQAPLDVFMVRKVGLPGILNFGWERGPGVQILMRCLFTVRDQCVRLEGGY